MRRHAVVALVLLAAIGGCSLFLDSGEFSSEDPNAGGPDSSASEAASGDVVVPPNDAMPESGGDANGNTDAGTDFCTRSFANAALYVPFELPIQAGWSRVYNEPYATEAILGSDGKPSPAVSFTTDSGVPFGTFRVAWLEKDVTLGKTYRFGFDVKTPSPSMFGLVSVARLELAMPDAGVEYGMSLAHGLENALVSHRFGPLDGGGAAFADDPGLGPASTSWTSYRVELTIVPGGTSRYIACRDGAKVLEKDLTRVLAIPAAGWFDIGITYVDKKQTSPIEVRFDNVFLEVVP